ncbi:MAG: hypothetical protein HZB16_22440 [Armatimonadetes bacterium]|nr:hypothetical protein [Armatimonadota bacterium]
MARGVTVTIPFHPTLSPCQAYDLALRRGMTHVTFTDHDTIAGGLDLLARHADPSRFVMGEEVTCFHAGACLHIGVFGLTPADHDHLHAGAERTDREQRCLRWNVPQLLAYCAERGLVCELKHPLWTRDGTPMAPTLRAALPMFALFEGINGTRHRQLNELGAELCRVLRPGAVFTGGSDSHTDNIGTTWTETHGETPEQVLASLRGGDCRPMGDHGSHRRLDSDVRACVLSNATGRAGHFVALADDYWHNMPLAAQDMLALAASAGVAYATVSEFARQRQLARDVAEAMRDELSQARARLASEQGEAPDGAPQGGLVH